MPSLVISDALPPQSAQYDRYSFAVKARQIFATSTAANDFEWAQAHWQSEEAVHLWRGRHVAIEPILGITDL